MEIEKKNESQSCYDNRDAENSNTYFLDLQEEYENDESFSQKACLILHWVSKNLMNIVHVLLLAGYVVYLCFAVRYDPAGTVVVFVIGILYLFYIIVKFFKLEISGNCNSMFLFLGSFCKRTFRKITKRIITVILVLGLITFILYDTWDKWEKLTPLGGLAIFLFILFITSKSPRKVKWMTVIWGILLQFLMGIIILRWPPGYAACKFVGDQVAIFLLYTDAGSKFVFGETTYLYHVVIFKILPVVVYFSAIVSILYYLGIMQMVIKAIAKVFEVVLETTAIESFATSAQIFVGAVETSVTLKPFLNDITRSELHAVLTSGFATVAGTVIAAYIEFGVPPEHVISASFMSAPAALAVSKLGWPEEEKSKNLTGDDIQLDVGNESNIMEAASAGATTAVKLVAFVVVNLIAFIAILAFIDAVISYYGSRVGHPEVNFEFLCSYIFMPLAVVMGVPWEDCGKVASLIGKKLIINEFLSFADLGAMTKSGELQGRSVVIATYILCGFGSIAAVGINLGSYTAAEPRRRRDYAKGMLRALIAGNIACFMTACIAGLLYQDVPVSLSTNTTTPFNQSLANFTSSTTQTTII